ncbi:MAG TPA: hypothetical protein VKV24_18165 [Casimicrobiaceae bacterium]|nr:hypothetical protein [Casimicrobiaceae bacterium]
MMSRTDMGGCARRMALPLVFAVHSIASPAQSLDRDADALLAIDQHRSIVVERIVDTWGARLAQSSALVSIDELRSRLMALRADRLLAATLAGTLDGVREVLGVADAGTRPGLQQTKALGDSSIDVVYTPVTPCRLVETRGTFAAVYQGDGSPSHKAIPFTPNEIRSYTVQGGNGVCLTQLPAGLEPSAVQLQVFGIPTTSRSGDIEILPQGASFGSTATMVYVGSIAFNTVSTAARVNLANNEISVQVRGGGAHLAIDVVGYFAAPSGNGGKFFAQGGNAFGTVATLGVLDNQPVEIHANGQRVVRYEPTTTSPNVIAGDPNNAASANPGQTIGGGGDAGNNCYDPSTKTYSLSCGNVTTGAFATVAGGYANAAGSFGAIAGGTSNVGGFAASIGGGSENTALDFGTVAGGQANQASLNYASVGGGSLNTASGLASTIAGGSGNSASGSYAFVGSGQHNHADGDYNAVVGGIDNQAFGAYSVIAGGAGNIVTSNAGASFVAGTLVHATHIGQFVWADNQQFIFDPGSPPSGFSDPTNTFAARATGGVWFVTGINSSGVPTTGARFHRTAARGAARARATRKRISNGPTQPACSIRWSPFRSRAGASRASPRI